MYFTSSLCDLRQVLLFLSMCIACTAIVAETQPAPGGDAIIRARFRASDIVISTTNRLAGAIHSLRWKGTEFIDSYDHGRQLQSACSFDCGLTGEFWAECFNPTEAGSRDDGLGNRSSSKLLQFDAHGAQLRSTSQMAFWLAPGEKSFGRLALNKKILSDYRLTKRVRIGFNNLPNVIDYKVTFTVPKGEHHQFAQFEALTGYMPPAFSKFWTFRPASGKLVKLSDGPGEQEYPVVFATRDGGHAMGIYSKSHAGRGYQGPSYGRWRFNSEKVVKWNCVFRVRDANGISAGDYSFQLYVAVGTLEDVRQALVALMAKSGY